MTKRKQIEFQARKELINHDWDVSKTDSVEFNGGSETTSHFIGKALAAQVLREHGYRVSSEVKHPLRGEIDVLAYGEDIIAVEIETDPKPDVIKDKIKRYVEGTPIRDIFVIEPPTNTTRIAKAKEDIENRLF